MSNMKLWVDDIRKMPKHYHYHAKTSKEAIVILQKMRISEISLDHDLGEEENGTGYDVAKWIEKAAYHKAIQPIIMHIHTANPVGYKNIEVALKNACRFWGANPYYYLI